MARASLWAEKVLALLQGGNTAASIAQIKESPLQRGNASA